MDFDMITVRDDITVEVVSRYLRRLDEMPDHTDQLFVVDREDCLRGLLPVNRLLVTDLDVPVSEILVAESVKLHPEEKAQDAALAFERYDLVAAPVVDDDGRVAERGTHLELLQQSGIYADLYRTQLAPQP
jgi:magnesium transporter